MTSRWMGRYCHNYYGNNINLQCIYEEIANQHKLVCGVNFWQFPTKETIKAIGDILDDFFSHQKEKR